MKTCLVTGATGFVGRRLVSKLAELKSDVQVIGAGRRECDGPWNHFSEVDLGQPDAQISLEGVDTVFHLASKAHAVSERPGDDSDYRAVIVDGTRRLVAAAEVAGVQRFLYVSSVKAMGEGDVADKSQPIDETMSPEPKTPYGCCKLEAEGIVLESSIPHVVVLRPVMVYGFGHKGNLVRMAEAIRKGRFPPISENNNRRSMVHVNDLVEACVQAIISRVNSNRGTYIIANGKALSTRELYDELRNEMGMRPINWSVPRWVLFFGAKIGDLIGKISGRRMPLDSDIIDKLLGSAWYTGRKGEDELGISYQDDRGFLK
jgi:nucleoside-diphosphate-sugar epimerase